VKEKATFSFGKNWQRFLKSIDDERIKKAKLSLPEFLRLSNLSGRSFIDIGCGSGLFSYAAFALGALMELLYIACYCAAHFLKLRNP